MQMKHSVTMNGDKCHGGGCSGEFWVSGRLPGGLVPYAKLVSKEARTRARDRVTRARGRREVARAQRGGAALGSTWNSIAEGRGATEGLWEGARQGRLPLQTWLQLRRGSKGLAGGGSRPRK